MRHALPRPAIRREVQHWARRLGFCLVLCCYSPAWAQGLAEDAADRPTGMHTAPVNIDGETLFYLRGVTALPAEQRAARVRQNILAVARDESIDAAQLEIREAGTLTHIAIGDNEVLTIVDADAEIEGIPRSLLAQVYRQRIVQTIEDFRTDRSAAVLTRNSVFALVLTSVMVLLIWLLGKLFRWSSGWAERRVQKRVEALADRSHQLIRAHQVWTLMLGLGRLLRIAFWVLVGYFYLNTVLGLFPWTREIARVLFRLVLNPLYSLWTGFVDELPNLMFLVVLWLVTRYLLKLVRAFFNGVGSGRIRLKNFEADWAEPTYKIARVLMIAFALVIAYPYIPGSDSLAFKGVSVFVGVLLSLGSSSFVANMIAGVTMTYRGAFREGDLIRVGETAGRVEDIKLMVTRLRTAKNESVILPNSTILNTEVVNLSQQAQTDGLVIHTTVGIGYDTPWRQVEAMLLEAVARTRGLKQKPAPFVLQLALGDFAVEYQVNAFWEGDGSLLAIRSALHGNIQDVFNEHGVQIMSPAYENDPQTPKVVAPENWYPAPAKKP